MATKDKSVTPKATLTVNSIGKGFNSSNVGAGATTTFKLKRSKYTASIALSDQTVRSVESVKGFKDVVAQIDYKAPRSITLNGKYELGTKKYTAGATWDGTVADKATTLKLWYTNKDNLLAGEATLNLNKTNKINTTFNQKQLQTAKYTWVKDDFTVEPSYNFVKKAPAVAVTKKLGSKDTLKIAYDLKSENATAEWAHKPFKVTLSSSVSRSLKVGRPSLAATYENTFDF